MPPRTKSQADRDVRVTVRLRAKDHEAIEAAADRLGLDVSAFMRAAALDWAQRR